MFVFCLLDTKTLQVISGYLLAGSVIGPGGFNFVSEMVQVCFTLQIYYLQEDSLANFSRALLLQWFLSYYFVLLGFWSDDLVAPVKMSMKLQEKYCNSYSFLKRRNRTAIHFS